jgi:hypothetical protein
MARHLVRVQRTPKEIGQAAAVPLLGGARLARKGAGIQASLASPAGGAEPIRWAESSASHFVYESVKRRQV